jgi:hypothetical protein
MELVVQAEPLAQVEHRVLQAQVGQAVHQVLQELAELQVAQEQMVRQDRAGQAVHQGLAELLELLGQAVRPVLAVHQVQAVAQELVVLQGLMELQVLLELVEQAVPQELLGQAVPQEHPELEELVVLRVRVVVLVHQAQVELRDLVELQVVQEQLDRAVLLE